MARERRTLDVLLDEVFLILKTAPGYFTKPDLAALFNHAKDEREMQLHEAAEGYGLVSVLADLVNEQALYDIPDGAGRLSRVLRVFSEAEGLEVPLVRNERWGEPVSESFVGIGMQYLPTYRLLGSQIRLDPPPAQNEIGGLRLEFEEMSERMELEDKIPVDWPVFSETLLVLDTVLKAYEVERAQGDAVNDTFDVNPHRTERNRYAARWEVYIETRSRGRAFAQGFRQGA